MNTAAHAGPKVGRNNGTVPEVVLSRFREALQGSPVLRILKTRRGLMDAQIKRFGLGCWDERLVFPVYDEAGSILGFKVHKGSHLKPDGTVAPRGQGVPAQLYPHFNLEADPVWLSEGEPDVWRLDVEGVRALTGTAGAGAIPPGLAERLKGRDVVIAFDNDEAGRQGQAKVVEALRGRARRLRVVEWPPGFPDGFDLSDWLNSGRSLADLPLREVEVSLQQVGEPAREERGTAYGRAALDDEAEKVRQALPGQQEATLNAAALKLGSLVAAGVLDYGETLTALVEAGGQMANQQGRPPWTLEQVRRKVEHGLADGMRQPRAVPAKNGQRANAAVVVEGESALPVEEKVEAFPLKALTSPLRVLVKEGAAAIQCPPDFIAVPLLTAAGAAAGATCCLVLKAGWEELPALFTSPVGRPGDAKTAAQQLATRPVFDQAAKLRQRWEAEMTAYDAERVQWEKGQSVHKPQPPRMGRIVISDATVEATAQTLSENSRGALNYRDELTAWVQSLDAYRSGKGADRQFYLSVWSSAPCSVDRKKQDRPIILDRPFLAITGALQPDTIRTLLHEDRRDDGFIDRILFAYPDALPPRHWSEATVQPATLEQVNTVFTKLYGLPMALDGPVQVRMSEKAKALWIAWYEQHQAELVEVEENLRGAWAKMPIQAARLILISHLTRWAAGEAAAREVADQVSVAAGTALAEYFKSHARRVWGVLGEREGGRTARRLVEWLKRKGNPGVRSRDVVRAEVPGIRTAEEAKRVLDGLAENGKGEWRQPPAGLAGQRGPELFFLFLPDTRHSGISLDLA